MDFVIHWHESAMDLHVFPILIPAPTSLSPPSLWVFPVHQARALVSCIQPGLVICFTLDNIHVSMLFSWNIPPSPPPTESKSLFYTSVSLFHEYFLYGKGNALVLSAAKSLQSCPTLCDPIDGSPPGSSVPGVLQARTLVWVAISFSNAWKWKVKVKSPSRVRLFETPWTAASQASLSMGFSRQEYWSGVPLPSPLFYLKLIKRIFFSVLCKIPQIWPHLSVQFSSVAQSCLTLCDPMDCSMPGFPVHHQLPDLAQTHVVESVMLSNHLILCLPLLLLPSVFPSIRVFSSESVLWIRCCKMT